MPPRRSRRTPSVSRCADGRPSWPRCQTPASDSSAAGSYAGRRGPRLRSAAARPAALPRRSRAPSCPRGWPRRPGRGGCGRMPGARASSRPGRPAPGSRRGCGRRTGSSWPRIITPTGGKPPGAARRPRHCPGDRADRPGCPGRPPGRPRRCRPGGARRARTAAAGPALRGRGPARLAGRSGWYAYSPLTSSLYSPGAGADMWIMGLVLAGLGRGVGGRYATSRTSSAPGASPPARAAQNSASSPPPAGVGAWPRPSAILTWNRPGATHVDDEFHASLLEQPREVVTGRRAVPDSEQPRARSGSWLIGLAAAPRARRLGNYRIGRSHGHGC
jgi:hypothetical protein